MASIDKRPDGKYRARWREYAGGPQRSRTFSRKVDAQRFLVEVQHSQHSGTYVGPERARVTLREFAELHITRQPWRAGTESTARAALHHALVVLGDRPLNTVRRGDVQALLAGIERSPGTVRLVRQHLTSVLQASVDDGLLVRNPARGVKVAASAGGEVVPPTTSQVQALYDAAPDWFRVAIVLGAGLGLRQAEASGLTADWIDWLRDRSVRIDRQWRTKARPWAFTPPKSEASVRTIPAAATVLAELGAHVGPRRTGFVLSIDGAGAEAVDHNRFGVAWRRTMKAAELEGFRFHGLRHYFASSLISAGCSVKAVQHALGHASAAVTLDTYGHLWPGDEDRIRAAVDAAFASAEDSLRTGALQETIEAQVRAF